jgi:ABC-type multidrug transport system ATPase subunit
MLAMLKEQNITILASTAYMDEGARCERIALMSEGKILEVCPPPDHLEDYFIEKLQTTDDQ